MGLAGQHASFLGEAHEADGNFLQAKAIFQALQTNPQNSTKKRARYLSSESSSRTPKKYGDDFWNMLKMW